MDPVQRVRDIFAESIQLNSEVSSKLAAATEIMTNSLLADSKILSCDNGGSTTIAQYFTSVILNRFGMWHPGLHAVALTTDSSTMTSIANDYQYAEVYSKQTSLWPFWGYSSGYQYEWRISQYNTCDRCRP